MRASVRNCSSGSVRIDCRAGGRRDRFDRAAAERSGLVALRNIDQQFAQLLSKACYRPGLLAPIRADASRKSRRPHVADIDPAASHTHAFEESPNATFCLRGKRLLNDDEMRRCAASSAVGHRVAVGPPPSKDAARPRAPRYAAQHWRRRAAHPLNDCSLPARRAAVRSAEAMVAVFVAADASGPSRHSGGVTGGANATVISHRVTCFRAQGKGRQSAQGS